MLRLCEKSVLASRHVQATRVKPQCIYDRPDCEPQLLSSLPNRQTHMRFQKQQLIDIVCTVGTRNDDDQCCSHLTNGPLRNAAIYTRSPKSIIVVGSTRAFCRPQHGPANCHEKQCVDQVGNRKMTSGTQAWGDTGAAVSLIFPSPLSGERWSKR